MKFCCIQVPSPISKTITNDIALKGINTSNKLVNSYEALLVGVGGGEGCINVPSLRSFHILESRP